MNRGSIPGNLQSIPARPGAHPVYWLRGSEGPFSGVKAQGRGVQPRRSSVTATCTFAHALMAQEAIYNI